MITINCGVGMKRVRVKPQENCSDPTQICLAIMVRNNDRVSQILSALEWRGASSRFCL